MLTRGSPARAHTGANVLDIALVNNMPDGALRSTERQFLKLLASASHGAIVRLRFYAIPSVARGERGRQHVDSSYSPLPDLWDQHLDAILVTGAEPSAPSLKDEPYWPDMARLVDWAQENTHSAIWSCLAAHAAVLHLDGIARYRLSEKRFGLFECHRAIQHPLLDHARSSFVVPHSRWNDLPHERLTGCGYEILTRAGDASVDAFAKQYNSLFVFFQGHPEYDANTLMREYLRDARRYLNAETNRFPAPPVCYFNPETTPQLAALREQALVHRRPELMDHIRLAVAGGVPAHSWRTSAVRIYSNWLNYLCARKADASRQLRRVPARQIGRGRRFAAGA